MTTVFTGDGTTLTAVNKVSAEYKCTTSHLGGRSIHMQATYTPPPLLPPQPRCLRAVLRLAGYLVQAATDYCGVGLTLATAGRSVAVVPETLPDPARLSTTDRLPSTLVSDTTDYWYY